MGRRHELQDEINDGKTPQIRSKRRIKSARVPSLNLKTRIDSERYNESPPVVDGKKDFSFLNPWFLGENWD